MFPVALVAIGTAVMLTACGSSGKASNGSSASGVSAGIKLAECMRSHGVPNFPDPSGGGIAFGSPGAFLSVPQTLMQSPAFKQAAAECDFPGAGRGGSKRPVPSG